MSNNLISDLDKIINKYFLEVRPVSDKANSDLVDPILKNIIYNKYNTADLSTDMTNEQFYQNLIINNNTADLSTDMTNEQFYQNLIINNNTFFYLTNGINKLLKGGGSGTNKAITTINKDFFDLNNDNVIFKSKDIAMGKLQVNEYNLQNIVNPNILKDSVFPGTVLFKNIPNFKYKNKYNIEGVYHINGWVATSNIKLDISL
jgi:uncharacterized protein YjgD (DUF1641 family)